jgi:fructose-bisphosphate aldolase class II
MTELMKDAQEKGYAVGAFNAVSFESLRAIIAAAEETGKGVILNHAEVHFPIMPLEVIAPVMVDMAKKASVPVCVHLDHGTDLDYVIRGLELGFTSVMYDGSTLSTEENVANTKIAVKEAKKTKSVRKTFHVIEINKTDAVENEEKEPVKAKRVYRRKTVEAVAAQA